MNKIINIKDLKLYDAFKEETQLEVLLIEPFSDAAEGPIEEEIWNQK
jgi:hypothetical protein